MSTKKKIIISILVLVVLGGAFAVYKKMPIVYSSTQYAQVKDTLENMNPFQEEEEVDQAPVSSIEVTHIPTPTNVKAIYMSSWVAGSIKYRDPLVKLIDDTELNAIVIDVKDSTGKISFPVSDPKVSKYDSAENRIVDVRGLTNLLHKKNIYIIGRVAVFQDPYLAKKKPEWAITKKSDGGVWKDRKGLSFLDPANKDVHDYIVALGHEAYDLGFDEINFDYIRYPSDGNIEDINYHLAEGRTRADNLEIFFTYLSKEMKKDKNIPISADLFGLTTEVNDDMGIGQVWEKALPHFDYLAPMIYPSHYPNNTHGFKNPAEHPYEIINTALKGAIAKTKAQNGDVHKIRPWLQDFNLGAIYTADMIRAQIKAANDNGITSWMMWDPKNKYTRGALLVETKQ
jgi:hypothetical protein